MMPFVPVPNDVVAGKLRPVEVGLINLGLMDPDLEYQPPWNSSAGSCTARFPTILRVAWNPSPRASGLSRTTRLSGSRESRSLSPNPKINIE